MRMLGTITRLNCLLVFTLILGCASAPENQRPEGRVIERSKQSKPVWADAPSGQLIVNATEAKIHHFSPKKRDLPISIKTAQSDAIENSFASWRPSFLVRLNEFTQLMATKSTKNEQEFNELIEQAARRVHTQAAQVEDIYYERIQIDSPEKVPELAGVNEYFDVHILVQLLPVETEKIQAALYQVFQQARSPDLKRAVREFAPKPTKAVKQPKRRPTK